jgi:methylenetetrahydrofolate reductase (NADPH)
VIANNQVRSNSNHNPLLAAGYSSVGHLEGVLRSGQFAITAELAPPDSASPQEIAVRAQVFKGYVDALNATDGSGANCHMSSTAVCALLTRLGFDAILQISCRDRNRIAIQGDVLGAAALGINNILCLTGDGVQVGDHPQAKPVFDLDSISLLATVRTLRDESHYLSGRKITQPPQVFLGAAENPFAPPFDFRPLRLSKKIAAGAQFIQTQYCYDIERLRTFMQAVCDLGLQKKVFILIGVGPLASAKSARWIRSHIPGIAIPDSVIKRLAGAQDQQQEGLKICVELVQQIREIEGIAGVHFMAHRQEELVAEIIDRSDVRLKRDSL